MRNNLLEAVVTAKTTHTFKNRLDKYWENHPLRWEYTAEHDYTIENITYNIEHATNYPTPEESWSLMQEPATRKFPKVSQDIGLDLFQ